MLQSESLLATRNFHLSDTKPEMLERSWKQSHETTVFKAETKIKTPSESQRPAAAGSSRTSSSQQSTAPTRGHSGPSARHADPTATPDGAPAPLRTSHVGGHLAPMERNGATRHSRTPTLSIN